MEPIGTTFVNSMKMLIGPIVFLTAELIAFGAWLLVSSLIPPNQKEREAANALKSAAEPVTTQLADAARDMAQGLKEPAQEAIAELEPVKESVNVSDLAALLCVSKRSLGKVLQRPAESGLPDKGAQRRRSEVVIQLTRHGRNVLTRAESLISALTEDSDEA